MAAKRGTLTAEGLVVTKQGQATETPSTATEPAAMAITSVHLPRDLLAALRMAAIKRADRHGGRPSVSAVIRDVLERHRYEIEAGQL